MKYIDLEQFERDEMKEHRNLDRKIQRENRRKHARKQSESKEAEVVAVSTMRRSPTTLPNQTGCQLVSRLRRDLRRQLEEENRQGGNQRNEMNDTPTLGTLVIKLVMLKEVFKEKEREAQKAADTYNSPDASERACGKAIAYASIVQHLCQLIESTSPYKPIGG